MAVEIPVYVNISGAFNQAAAQVPKEMPKLERAISKNVLNIPIYLSGRGFNNVRDVLTSTTISAKELKTVLKDLGYEFNRMSKATQDQARTSAQVNNLAKAYALVEQRLKGVYNASTAAGMKVQDTINKVQYKLNNLRNQLQGTQVGTKAFNDINYQILVQEQRLRKLNTQYEQYRILSMRATNNVASSMQKANNSLFRQMNLMQSISSLAASYLSIWQVGRLMHNIRETTAEFEMQRVALGGIIQDSEKANSLFREIKAAALQSPFEIKDLVSYTKQLSAYRIETDKLFDVTKRLADVSAGLGVDMGRVILAYGQVRAASVLRGQELRQFTEAGIPLVELLAKKFEELGRVGTTTADVFELISKRAVPFSMIEEIFEDMTEAGGTFYKMQERQAETLAGQWANLKDALSIMYDEIGNTPAVHKAMEDLISGAKTLMNNWRQIATVIKVVGQQFIALKLASLFMPTLAYNTKMAEKATQALAQAEALEAKQAQNANVIRSIAIKNLHNYARAMGRAAAAQTAFGRGAQSVNAWLAKGWVGLATAAITVLVGVIVSAIQKSNQLKNELNKIGTEGALSINRSVSNFKRLADAAVNAADGSEEQNKAIAELKRTYGDIIPVEELQVKKLRALEGSYQSLTAAIEEKINMQIREQKINAAMDAYSSKITNANKRAQRMLVQYGLDKDQIRAVMSEIQKEVDDGLLDINKSVATQRYELARIVKNMTGIVVDFGNGFRDYAGQWHNVGDTQDRAFKSMQKILSIYSDLHKDIDTIENDMDSLTGTMGVYAKSWKNLESDLKNVLVSEDIFGKKGSFAYNEELLKQKVEKMATAIEDAFKDTEIDIADAFTVPGQIDFKFLGEAAKQAAANGNWGLDSFVGKIQKRYDELVPSDPYVSVIKAKFQDIANSIGISMNDIQGHLMKSGEDVRKYTKGIKDSLQEAEDELSKMNQQNEMAEKSFIVPFVDADKKKKQEDLVTFLKALLEFLDGYAKHNKGPRDTRLSQLKSDISELTNAYKKFTELMKYKPEEEALIDINKMFPQLKGLAPTFDNVLAELKKKLADVKAQLARSPKSKTLLDMQRALETEISNLDFDKLKTDLDKQLKKLSDEMKRSETARDFYNNILGLTGDEELAASMAVTVYGGFGKDFKQRMQEQLNEALASISADARTPELVNAVAGQDFKTILANLDKFPEKWQEELKKMANDSQKFSADQIQTWLKELNEFKSYGDKRVQLARQTAERIAEINASDLSRAEKQSLISQYRNKEAKEAAKLQYEAFKDSALYVDMFENLDNASVTMLTNMRDRLIELKGQWKNLDPVQLKEMEKRIEEINKQLGTRNPFKMLSEGIKEYQKLQAKGTRAQADQAAMDALKKQVKEEQKLERAVSEVTRAQQAYDLIVASKGENSLEARSAKAVLNAKKQQLGAQKKLADQAKTEADIAQNNANQWQKAADKIQSGAEGIMSYAELAASALKVLNSAFASEADAAYYNEQIDNITKSLEGAAAAAQGIAKIVASGGADVSAWVSAGTGLVSFVTSIVNAINAAKVKKANDEIERQERAISDLEYAYSRLDKAIDESFGDARIYNYTQQVENLTQKLVKLEAELAAERTKGNKASQDAINGYLDKIRDTKDALADLKKSQADFWAGQELTSASEAFVNSWISAKKEFGDTTKAIEETMQQMVENLISKAAMSGVVQAVLKPWYDELNQIEAWDTSTIARMVKSAYDKIPLINQGLEVAYSSLASAGVDIRRSVGNLTGISRNYATASEESILGLTAATNTQNYYMSYVPTIADHVAAIRMKVAGDVAPTVAPASAEGPSYEDQMLAYAANLPLMRSDTEAIRTMLERVIKPQGATATHYVSVRM